MAKKKFTDGLESLFGGPSLEEKFQDNPLLSDSEPSETIKTEEEVRPKASRKRKTGKSFTSDLDSLFEEVLQESFEEKLGEKAQGSIEVKVAKPHQSARRRRPVMGLDVLIRHTSNLSKEEMMTTSFQKRVTFVYDREKVAKLKSIAKENKLYMKDIIGKAVSAWLKEYERDNGRILEE